MFNLLQWWLNDFENTLTSLSGWITTLGLGSALTTSIPFWVPVGVMTILFKRRNDANIYKQYLYGVGTQKKLPYKVKKMHGTWVMEVQMSPETYHKIMQQEEMQRFNTHYRNGNGRYL